MISLYQPVPLGLSEAVASIHQNRLKRAFHAGNMDMEEASWQACADHL
jgi:hypothetical protein